jgi:CheY-like chemotaxis protein
MIRDMGHDIMCVQDGSEAVAQYRQAMETGNRFDITILDITVPGGMGGKEACEKILGIDSTASVVVSSGYSHEDIMYNYSRYGFVKSIPKPYSYYDLVNLINSLS